MDYILILGILLLAIFFLEKLSNKYLTAIECEILYANHSTFWSLI